MTKEKIPSPALLHKLLRYEHNTGKLYWRLREGRSDQTSTYRISSFNKRFANREAMASFNSYGYRVGSVLNVKLMAHRVIWAMCHDVWPTNHIDHINGVRDDNRIINLRDVRRCENQKNMKIHNHNKTGQMGVCWHKQRNKWRATIWRDNKQVSLGLYNDFNEAVAVRKKAEIDFGYHKNHGRL